MNPPAYFSPIERKARERWDQLESDPDLAAPWHQLFRQVQSPRHVVSELLQNADDARATKAALRIADGSFIFEHNGRDFVEDEFASLCRFGFSNKRQLHTIGFRGIGFKSTFSLGDPVEVRTPTLSVQFSKKRFTQPKWVTGESLDGLTTISVPLASHTRKKELKKNCQEWLESPVSLLFFKHLRELSIDGEVVSRRGAGRGPVPNSKWVRLSSQPDSNLLVISSGPLSLPKEAIDEIREERQVDDLNLPSVQIDLVLGVDEETRLYVVLPTGVKAKLPFSCNAPFIQDPGRYAIKDPATSATNEWLLKQAGILAAETMLAWLRNDQLTVPERARAYGLLPVASTFGSALEDSCLELVRESFVETVGSQPVLLTPGGGLVGPGTTLAIPAELHGVWSPSQTAELFGDDQRHLLSPDVDSDSASTLAEHGWVTSLSASSILEQLRSAIEVPRPKTWVGLRCLWDFVQAQPRHTWFSKDLRIVPVRGEPTLAAAKSVVRFSARLELLRPEDWDFLSGQAPAVDPDFLQWLGKQRKEEAAEGALRLLQELGLHEPSSADRIAAEASRRVFAGHEVDAEDAVRLTQILAVLKAPTPGGFYFCTQGDNFQEVEAGIIHDPAGHLSDMLPPDWVEEHVLKETDYADGKSCTTQQWREWSLSPHSKLAPCIAPACRQRNIWSRREIQRILSDRGAERTGDFKYKRENFTLDDYDFPQEVLEHWERLASERPGLWVEVLRCLLKAGSRFWFDTTHARIRQIGNAYTEFLACSPIPSKWVLRFRGLRCLPNQNGEPRLPSELLLLNQDTEPMRGIESFVALELDTQENRPLLELLGVRSDPTGTDKVVERLRATSKAREPQRLIVEINRLYEALDRIVARAAPSELDSLSNVFAAEPLVLSESGDWMTRNELSVYSDEDRLAPAVHHAFQDLHMWPRLGVPDRPALENNLEWLRTIEPETKLDGASQKRAALALSRGGLRVWDELGYWLSLDQTWEPLAALKYQVSMHSLTRWERLSSRTKRATADLRMLPGAMAEETPFTSLRPLVDVIQMRVTQVELSTARPRRMAWLQPLAEGLGRVKLRDEKVTASVREVARLLLDTNLQTVSRLEVTPHIDAVPAGEPLMPKAFWADTTLYVADQSIVRLYRELKEEIARPFVDTGVKEAVAHCIDRSAEFVREYLEANFEIEPQPELTPAEPSSEEPAPQTEGPQAEASTPEERSESLPAPEEPAADPDAAPEQPGDSSPEPPSETNAPPRSEKPARPKAPSFMDRYATERGFRWHEGERCYTHPSGAWITRAEFPFTWQEGVDGSDAAKHLFVAEQSLARGVEIPYELWRLMEITPDSIALVLCAEDGDPIEWSAGELQQFKAAGQVRLHQSRFILKETTSGLDD